MSVIETQSGVLRIPQVARFLLAGGSAALITWLLRFPLSYLLPFAGAVAVANVIGMVFGFVTYRRFVFPGSSRLVSQQLSDFVIVNLLSTVVVVVVSIIFANRIFPAVGFTWEVEAISHMFGIAAGAVSNYLGHRRFSFARD